MAAELLLTRADKNTSWGFRLAGGADFDVPLTVIKVTPGSISERAGLSVGDVVVRINDTAISPLTHVEAHDVIVNGGNEFVIAVRRGDLSNLPPRLLLYETDTENGNVPKGTVFKNDQDNDADLNITDEEIATIIGEHIQTSQKKSSHTLECSETIEEVSYKKEERSELIQDVSVKKSEVAELIISQQEKDEQSKKWSTFLQKPRNPKPNPKPKEVDQQPKAAPYRVVIKKQPKKTEASPKKVTIKSPEDVKVEVIDDDLEVENQTEIAINENEEPNQENEVVENNEENVGNEIEEDKEGNIEENVKHVDEDEQEEEPPSESQSERKYSVNLEEQLAEVQRQLLALSQLPSAIQQTLNSVTKQLSELVSASQKEVEVTTTVRIEEEEIVEEQEGSVEYREQVLSVLEEASYEEEETTAGRAPFEEAARTESEDEQALFEALERECEMQAMEAVESQIRTEEEMEAHRIEMERQEKKEKEDRRGSSSHPLTPLQRPIILPGGRKWSEPHDVESRIRKPSLTDERIAKTISSYTEVVNHWNNIWPWCDEEKPVYRINFLKYQPPPKNLDYLQKSAVYRLIHDIEPPPKGIVARDMKVLAEQDYYSQVDNQESTVHAQLER